MKIVIFLPIWKRPEITELCLKGIQRLCKNWDITTVGIISEEWPKEMCERYGVHWVHVPNEPLGMKFNLGLTECLKFDFDYLLGMGSDNLIADKLLTIYQQYFDRGTDIFGIDKVCFIEGDRAKTINYDLTILGAGRCISHKALDHFSSMVEVEYTANIGTRFGSFNKGDRGWLTHSKAKNYKRVGYVKILCKPRVRLWDDERSKGMDSHVNTKLFKAGFSNKCIQVDEPLLIDLKSDVNIWDYSIFDGEEITVEEATKYIPECNQEALIGG